MLVRAPGVYRPQPDTWLLARAMLDAALPPGLCFLDACTGTGALAIAAARCGAGSVTAVDMSRAALTSAWINSRVRGIGMKLVRNDVREVVRERTFDVVLANPPYIPAATDAPNRRSARAWDAGSHGRDLLSPLCQMVPDTLRPGGVALIVHSSICGAERSLDELRAGGVKAAVVARATVPFGPVLRARTSWLEANGLITPGQRTEELVVIRADRTR